MGSKQRFAAFQDALHGYTHTLLLTDFDGREVSLRMKKWHFRRLRGRPGHTPSRRMTLLPLDTGATNGCCCLLPQLSFQFRRKSLNNFSYLFTIRAYKCARLSAKPATQPPPIWQISPPISPLSMDGCHKLSCRKWKRSVIDTQSKDTREKIK